MTYRGMIINCTFNSANATPMRQFDWVATIDGREEDGQLYGYGETKGEALAELGGIILERVDDHLYDLVKAGCVDDDVFTEIDGLAYLPY